MRALFTTRTLAELAASMGRESTDVVVPPNGIVEGTSRITPEMLPLVSLTQGAIDGIVTQVPGGASNVQDIYPLAPLQEGILFHHLLARQGDTYLTPWLVAFATRESLESFLSAVQKVMDRHDILRTSVAWEGLDEPVQVVQRHVRMPCTTVTLDPSQGEASDQLRALYDPRRYRIDVREAPLLRAAAAFDAAKGRWLLLLMVHHLAADHTTLDLLLEETRAIARGQESQLPAPVAFRNFVAQARLGTSREAHEQYFRSLLGDVEEPTAPFGLLDVQSDGSRVNEARQVVPPALSARIRVALAQGWE